MAHNFKTYSKPYKNKKRLGNDEENRAIFLNVHEPVIDRATWERVQQMRGTRKKRPKSQAEKSIFSGLLKCADCGANLGYHFNQGNREIRYFNCSNNNNSRGCTATHYIREDFLAEVVIQEIRRLTSFAEQYEVEQGEIAGRIKTLRKDLKNDNGQLVTADTFLEVVRRYTDAQELSQRMLTELMDHIDVYHAEKVSVETTQKVTIHYNCIGAFDVPEWDSIPDIDILLQTRKGVAVSYSQSQTAVNF